MPYIIRALSLIANLGDKYQESIKVKQTTNEKLVATAAEAQARQVELRTQLDDERAEKNNLAHQLTKTRKYISIQAYLCSPPSYMALMGMVDDLCETMKCNSHDLEFTIKSQQKIIGSKEEELIQYRGFDSKFQGVGHRFVASAHSASHYCTASDVVSASLVATCV